MDKYTVVRRIRSGSLEAVLVRSPASHTQTRYGVFFRRIPSVENGQSFPFFDYGELLTVAKLARMAQENIMDVFILGEDE